VRGPTVIVVVRLHPGESRSPCLLVSSGDVEKGVQEGRVGRRG
jgi:hypothetical protein